jgi:hypothetical protein
MYISEATRDALCEAGIWGIGIVLGGMCLAMAMPWIMRKLKMLSLRVLIVCDKICIAVLRLLARAKKSAHRARDERRYRSAMKVFNHPVRWEEK